MNKCESCKDDRDGSNGSGYQHHVCAKKPLINHIPLNTQIGHIYQCKLCNDTGKIRDVSPSHERFTRPCPNCNQIDDAGVFNIDVSYAPKTATQLMLERHEQDNELRRRWNALSRQEIDPLLERVRVKDILRMHLRPPEVRRHSIDVLRDEDNLVLAAQLLNRLSAPVLRELIRNIEV